MKLFVVIVGKMYRRILFVVLLHMTIFDTYSMNKAYSGSLSVVVYYPCGSSNMVPFDKQK